ncbi:LysR family transcriptional regulator [Hydrogenophaga sp. Root209]|uniref:LysR family transcriptional regulator n=1 Tax=Hydrogenophaga sp. Root209 TaxID=1736490 RepID=UPI0007019CB0|nr:LysR family transcriptional regulator [Hydrogenophaga sp. Root209]KRC04544.1 LysR family transcriptional regulator [Hydrogenophaga sp. Root209]
MFDWEDLRLFTVFAQKKSLSAAARELKVDHATVARRVAALEGALRLKLVERRPRAYFLTPDGERIAEFGKRMEAVSFAVQRTASAGHATIAGEVTVTAPPAMAAVLIAPRLGELRERYPELHIRLDGDTRNVSLVRREADVAIRLSRPDDAELVVRKLSTVTFSLYGSLAYLTTHGVDARAYIAYDTSMDDTPQQNWLQAQAGPAPIVLRSNDLAVQAAAVAAGVGIGVLPDFMGGRDERLARLPHAGAALEREVWIAVHSDLRNAPRIKAVMAFLAGCFERRTSA